jgi:hypothetical protein
LFEGLVVEEVVKLFAGLHEVEDVGLRAIGGEQVECGFTGFHGDAEERDGIDHGRVAEVSELVEREQRAFAEFGHVGDERRFDGGGELLEFFFRLQGFGKNPVGAGIEVTFRAVNRVIKAGHAAGIGAGDNHQVLIGLGCGCRSQLGTHGQGLDERFAGQVSAALGELLVFELDGRRTGGFELDDRSLDVERFAKTGIGIDDQREGTGSRQKSRLLHQFGEREQADVGKGQHTGGKRRAGKVHGFVAAALDQAGKEGARSTGHLDGGVGD